MRKLHAPVWNGLQTALADTFNQGYPADKVIQRQLKANPKWGSGDRRLFAEALYDVVRWWRRLRDAVGFDWPAADATTGVAPADFARVTAAWCLLNDVEPAPNVRAPAIDADAVRTRWSDAGRPRAVRESVPEWLDHWGESQLGARWPETLRRLNDPAPVFLRVNRLKTTVAAARAALEGEGVGARPAGADGLRLERRANVFLTEAFRRGWFEVQDLHSQRVAEALAPRPGERIIDACAGAGGKTLHLAALMENRGRIVAMDVGEPKLEELRRRARRAGAGCVETRLIDGTKVIKRLRDSADRVLLDVPCSGAGILRRNPDAKWRLSPASVAQVTALQTELLANYAGMCKPGGRLVYSTCSIMPSENEGQVAGFLSRNETWTLERQETLSPAPDAGDGFFIAVLKRQS